MIVVKLIDQKVGSQAVFLEGGFWHNFGDLNVHCAQMAKNVCRKSMKTIEDGSLFLKNKQDSKETTSFKTTKGLPWW